MYLYAERGKCCYFSRKCLVSGAINKWLLLNTVPKFIGCYEKISKTSYIPIVKCLAFTRDLLT